MIDSNAVYVILNAMWGIDRDTAAKHGAYRVVIPVKRARHRVQVQRMIDTFMDERIVVVNEVYPNKALNIFCTCRRQANMLANNFNGQLSYLLKLRYRRYADYHDKATAVEAILEANGTKHPRLASFYNFEVENKEDYDSIKTKYVYLPCRRSTILAKLSIPNLMDV